ncbi:hypothetical protein [Leptospira alexanderi]|uniref:hypothetical protein n=1 Tax=Leptospira alexanderi TaxID=100053 RepID=UPI00111552D4|nr:hypothetical protein [Leptospira alexanderi]
MDNNLIISLITVTGSIASACITYYLSKISQIKAEWQKEKMTHYKLLLASLSGLAGNAKNMREAHDQFALSLFSCSTSSCNGVNGFSR